MKISDYFKLPIEIEKIHFDEKHMARELNIGDGGECKAVNLAVNNFDDMYTEIQSDIDKLKVSLDTGGLDNMFYLDIKDIIEHKEKLLAKARGEQ